MSMRNPFIMRDIVKQRWSIDGEMTTDNSQL